MAKFTALDKAPPTVRTSCGTAKGYDAHIRYKEITCQPCRDAKHAQTLKRFELHPKLKEDRKLKTRLRYQKNPDKKREYERNYRANNLEQSNSYSRKWASLNPEKRFISRRKWHEANVEKRASNVRKRRAIRANAKSEKYTTEQILELYGTNCHICNLPIDLTAPRRAGFAGWQSGLHLDHVVALVNGGDDLIHNIRPSHGLCNIQKSAKEKPQIGVESQRSQ